MGDAYDRERTAVLIDEARQLTAALKIEAAEIKTVIDKAFDGNDGDEVQVVVLALSGNVHRRQR